MSESTRLVERYDTGPMWREYGAVLDRELDRLACVSPHFDDAVLSAGQLLAGHPGSTVVTVFGARPPRYPENVTWWDALGGFADGDDVVGARREEEREAMARIGAIPVRLDFADHQYGFEIAPAEEIAGALEPVLVDAEPSTVLIPLGLANPDHRRAHHAAMRVLTRHPEWLWLAYEDRDYRFIPGMLAHRIRRLLDAGVWATPVAVRADRSTTEKVRALGAYVSQLPALRDDWPGFGERLRLPVPESFWRLHRAPEGWGVARP